MSTATTMRRPICAEDPEEIFQVEARLLADYATAIERDVLKIAAKFPGIPFKHENQAIRRYRLSQAKMYVPSTPRAKPAENTFRSCSRGVPTFHAMPLSAARMITTPIPQAVRVRI